MSAPTNAPDAPVVRAHGRYITVTCPYCGDPHEHKVEAVGVPERHAPGCGLHASPQHRLVGYWIRTQGRD